MSNNQEREKIYKELYDISVLDVPINLETKDGIPPNRKLHTLYYNLLWKVDFKIPKIDGIKSLIVLLEYFYNKFNQISKISPNIISRKFEVYFLLIKQLLNIKINENDKTSLKYLEQYFFDKDFFSCFLLTLNQLNNKHFFDKFSFYSKVSINNI
jgi:hypothetical protein